MSTISPLGSGNRAPLVRRGLALAMFATCAACTGGSGLGIEEVRVYPPVRANTPDALAGAEAQASWRARSGPGTPMLGTAVEDCLYSGGPTDILRVLEVVDGRMAELDKRAKESPHACLGTDPVLQTLVLPAGQSFDLLLQCQDMHGDGSGWVAFGSQGDDFYLLEGMLNGMGSAYRVKRSTSRVEGYMIVADEASPNQSQVVLRLLSDKDEGAFEMLFAGNGVGFCSAHVKMDPEHIFVSGRQGGGDFCDERLAGCFAASALEEDLGEDDVACEELAAQSFALSPELDSEPGVAHHVDPTTLYRYFQAPPVGIETF